MIDMYLDGKNCSSRANGSTYYVADGFNFEVSYVL